MPIQLMSSWGRLSSGEHDAIDLIDIDKAKNQIAQTSSAGIAYGMGRSYGDSCLNPDGTLWLTSGLDNLCEFDEQTG